MPYIDPKRRRQLLDGEARAMTPGELHFIIAREVRHFLRRMDRGNGENYTTYNSVIGVLACAQMEVYRRLVAPYEDQAIARNGDVY